MTRQPDVTRSPDGLWEWDGQAWRPASEGATAVRQAPAVTGRRGGRPAVASLVLGLISMVTWVLPIVGLPIAATGFALGILAVKGVRRRTAVAGIVLSAIGLVAATINFAVGVYLGASGQLRLFR